LFELSLSPIKPQLADLARRQRVFPGKDCLYLLELEPELYFKIAGMMDASMASGHLALEYAGSKIRFQSEDLSLSLLGEAGNVAATTSSNWFQPGRILPLDEDAEDPVEGEGDDYNVDLTSIELLSRGLGLFGE
jgi:hypothetical protein